MNLVNKDQLEILESLRASVSVEQDKLAEELARARESLKVAEDKAKSHRDEIDKLLREKIELQGEGINQRDKMLEREKEFGSVFYLSLSRPPIPLARTDGSAPFPSIRGLSDVDRTKLAQSEQENSDLRNQVESLEEKLQKMKAVNRTFAPHIRSEGREEDCTEETSTDPTVHQVS